jgi:uncharacterized membrane protein YciS (DUF1049 family)
MSKLSEMNDNSSEKIGGDITATEMDEFLETLSDDTTFRPEGIMVEPPKQYKDFEPLPSVAEQPPASENPKSEKSKIKIQDDDDDDDDILTSIASLPAETIVDTVDVFATEFIIKVCHVVEYDGDDADNIITSPADKRTIVKVTEQYLASQKLKISPLTALLVTVGLVYGKKIMFGMKIKKIVERNRQLEVEKDELRRRNEELQRELERSLIRNRPAAVATTVPTSIPAEQPVAPAQKKPGTLRKTAAAKARKSTTRKKNESK